MKQFESVEELIERSCDIGNGVQAQKENSPGSILILQERRNQINKWPNDSENHNDGSLVVVAAQLIYLLPGYTSVEPDKIDHTINYICEGHPIRPDINPTLPVIELLTIAGALIAAEIDRLIETLE